MASANVANTLVVPVESTVYPYYDDFNEAKNFHRILFRPGFPVQSRELTQLQTILQNQIERFGRHVFQNGSPVIGGKVNIPTFSYTSIKLNPANELGQTVDVEQFLNNTMNLVGAQNPATELFTDDNTVQFKVVAVTAATLNDPPTIYGTYIGSRMFADGDVIKLQGEQSFALLQAESSHTQSSLAFINDSIFFINGYFVKIPSQAAVIGKYTTTPYCKVGLEINDEFVTESTDTTLLDPAQGASNYQAPGAARYQLTLNLSSRALTSTDTTKFIELARVENGQVKSLTQYPIYSEIEEVMARRTYDESGNYTVRPFVLKFEEDEYDPTNYYAARLSPGKAYVMGYEFETISESTVRVPKARSTVNVASYDYNLNYGNYVIVDGVKGLFDTSNASTFDIHCVNSNLIDTANSNTYSKTKIGTAKINYVNYYGGANLEDVSNRQYEFYIFDTEYGSIKSNAVVSIGYSNSNVLATYYTSNVSNKVIVANVQEEYVSSNLYEEHIYSLAAPNTITSNVNTAVIIANAQTVVIAANSDIFYANIGTMANIDLYFTNTNNDIYITNILTRFTANSLTINAVLPLQANMYYGAAFGIVAGQGTGYTANVVNFNTATKIITLDVNLPATNSMTQVMMFVRPNSYIKLNGSLQGLNTVDPQLFKNALLMLTGPASNNYLGNVVSYNASTQYLQMDRPFWTGTDFANGPIGGAASDLASIYLRPTNAVKIFNYSTNMNLSPELYVGAGLLLSGPNSNNYLGNVTSYNNTTGYVYVDKPFYTGNDYQNCPTNLDFTTIVPRPANAVYISMVTRTLFNYDPEMYKGAALLASIPSGGSGPLVGVSSNVTRYDANTGWMYVDSPLYNIAGKDFANSAASPLTVLGIIPRPSNMIRIYKAESIMNLNPNLYIGNQFVIAGGNGQGYSANVVSLNTSTWWMTMDAPFSSTLSERPTGLTLTAQIVAPLGALKVYNTSLFTEADSYYANSMLYLLQPGVANVYSSRVISYTSNDKYIYVSSPLPRYIAGNSTVQIVPRVLGTDIIKIRDTSKLDSLPDPGLLDGAIVKFTSGAGAGFWANVATYDVGTKSLVIDNEFTDISQMPLLNTNVDILLQTSDRFKMYGNTATFPAKDYANALVIFTEGPSGGYVGTVTSYNATSKYFTVDTPLTIMGGRRLGNTQVSILMQIANTVKLENPAANFNYNPYMYRKARLEVIAGDGSGYTANVISYNPANQRFTLDASYTPFGILDTTSKTKVTLQVANAVRLYDSADLFVNGSNVWPNAIISFASGNAAGYSSRITGYNTYTEYFSLSSTLPGNLADFDEATIEKNNPNNSVLVYDSENTFDFDPTEYPGGIFTITSGTGAGFTANIITYNASISLITLDKNFTTLPDHTSHFSVETVGLNNVVKLYNTYALFTNVANSYTGSTIRVLDGPGNGNKHKVLEYRPDTQRFIITPPFMEKPTGNVAVEFDFAEARSFYISTDYTPGGSQYTSNANANITIYNKVNNDITAASYILEPTLSTLLFKLPQDWIAPNLSYSAYSYTKRFDRSIVSGMMSQSIKANTNERLAVSTSSSNVSDTILENLLVVCTDKKSSTRTNGEIIKVTTSVVNNEMQIYTGNNQESFSATVFTTINLRSPTFPKEKIFVGCNTETLSTETSDILFGWPTGSFANVYPSAAQVLIFNSSLRSDEWETLYLSDVIGIEKIYDLNGTIPAPGDDLTGFSDVTHYYDFDNGQRDTHYDHAAIKLKPNFLAPLGPLVVCCYYFQHSKPNQGVGYFTVDSYFSNLPNGVFSYITSGVGGHDIGDGYSNIPGFTRTDGTIVNLRDCLDFRPSRKNASNVTPNYEFTDVEAPSPASDMVLSYAYYQGRKDLIVLNGDRQFQRIEGLSDADPLLPPAPARSMQLYQLDIPPYTEYSSNISVKFIENRRYTMRDIGKIDKRVENLEYYVTLNSLEKQAVETSILDVNGLDRTKYGIFVDSFTGHSLGAKDLTDYQCAMNVDAGYVTSMVHAESFDLSANTGASVDIMVTRDKIMLPYTETRFLTQVDASKSTSINEFVYGVFNGTIITLPDASIGISFVDPTMVNTTDTLEAPSKNYYQSIIDSYLRTYK